MCSKSTSGREGNGTPLQCSCLENPRDGGTWWAVTYEVAQSWTQLKRLSSSTSRLPFGNIARSPETVPPPTVFLQVSAPNLIAGSSTFEEIFDLFLSIPDRQSTSQMYEQLLHVHSSPRFPCWGKGSKQNPLRPVIHLSVWR